MIKNNRGWFGGGEPEKEKVSARVVFAGNFRGLNKKMRRVVCARKELVGKKIMVSDVDRVYLEGYLVGFGCNDASLTISAHTKKPGPVANIVLLVASNSKKNIDRYGGIHAFNSKKLEVEISG